ncbi:hypothetical protein [Streptomyces canus]|uniref:hypothetical protein n=1 Tax=Streptomyces canus TaxID=58343 RepID=UPI0036E9FB01
MGSADLKNLLVIPSQTRPARPGRSRLQVLTPPSVLGFGPGGVALWVGAPDRPGVQVVICSGQVAAIETVHILLYARLTVLAADARLSVRYNAVAERELQPLVLALRRRVAAAERELPPAPAALAALPYKWRRLLASDAVRLETGEQVAAVAGPLPVPRRAEPAYGAVVLTARELVTLADPVSVERAGGRYGVDTHYIPRDRIETVRADGQGLGVRACGTDIALPLGEDLAHRAVAAFARHVPVAAPAASPDAPH